MTRCNLEWTCEVAEIERGCVVQVWGASIAVRHYSSSPSPKVLFWRIELAVLCLGGSDWTAADLHCFTLHQDFPQFWLALRAFPMVCSPGCLLKRLPLPFCGVTRPRLLQSDVFFLSFGSWEQNRLRFFWEPIRVVWCVHQTIPWDQTVLWHGSLSFFLPSLLVLSPPFLIFQARFNFVTFKSCPVKFGFTDSQLLMFLKLGSKNPNAVFSLCIFRNR